MVRKAAFKSGIARLRLATMAVMTSASILLGGHGMDAQASSVRSPVHPQPLHLKTIHLSTGNLQQRHETKPTVTIRLQPSNAQAETVSHSSSRSMVKLPLYPGASPSTSTPDVHIDMSGSAYLKAGSARMVASAPLKKVETWYVAAMKKAGYVMDGISDGIAKSVPSRNLTFHARANADLTVELDFSTPLHKPNQTAIEYWVTETMTLQRPSTSFIPRDVTEVIIAYQPVSADNTPQPTIQRTITAQSTIRTLVQEINALPVDTRDTLYGTSTLHGGGSLRFVTASGKTIAVKLDFQHNRVQVENFPVLFDAANRVWQSVSTVMGFAPYPKH